MDNICHHLLQFLLQDVQWSVTAAFVLPYRQWQLFFVHLLILVQWNAVYLHRYSRHHIRRFLLHYEGVKGFCVHLFVSHDIGCYVFSASFLFKGLDRHIPDARILAYHALHLFQFYAEAAYLYLSVTTTHKLHVAVREITHHIACTVTTQS